MGKLGNCSGIHNKLGSQNRLGGGNAQILLVVLRHLYQAKIYDEIPRTDVCTSRLTFVKLISHFFIAYAQFSLIFSQI